MAKRKRKLADVVDIKDKEKLRFSSKICTNIKKKL